MKKTMILLLCVALISTSLIPVLAAPLQISDVPPGHWAYSAITKLLDKGYLSLYQDKTFRGDNSVDRYTFAVVIARLLSEMSVISTATPVQSTAGTVKSEDMQILRQLTTEFRDELVQLATVDETIRADLNTAAKELTVLREDLDRVLVQVYQNQQATKNLEANIQVLENSTQQNAQSIEVASSQIDQLNNDVRALDEDLKSLERKINEDVLTRASGAYVQQQNLEKEVQRLSQEFESYRRNTEAELKEQRNKNLILTIVAAVGLVAGLSK